MLISLLCLCFIKIIKFKYFYFITTVHSLGLDKKMVSNYTDAKCNDDT